MRILKLASIAALFLSLGLHGARGTCEAGECCRDFVIFCQGYCWTRGGVLLTNCEPGQFEHCICYEDEPYAGPAWYCEWMGE